MEKLESWVFVEWSKAADYVQDINYPTNMLYARMLEVIGCLYKDEQCSTQSEQLKSTIQARLFNGHFFTVSNTTVNRITSNGKTKYPIMIIWVVKTDFKYWDQFFYIDRADRSVEKIQKMIPKLTKIDERGII